MKMNEDSQEDDMFMDESDEFLLHMTDQLNQELSDITVSEDLIAKTLKVVKSEDEKSKVTTIDDAKASVKHKRNYKRIMVPLIEVAAACFVLFVGARLIGSGIGSKKCDESTSYSKPNSYDIAPEEAMDSAACESAEDSTNLAFGSESGSKENQMIASDEQETLESNKSESATESDMTASAETPCVEEITAVDVAIGAVEEEPVDESTIHTYQGEEMNDIGAKLLLLFSSDELKLCSDEAEDVYKDFIILSPDEESAILYKIGEEKYIVAQIYDINGLLNQTVYEVDDMEAFQNSLDLIIN